MKVLPQANCGIYANGVNIATWTHFCAGDIHMDSRLCTGDLGGPMFDEDGTVVGIASAGFGMCKFVTPFAYTRIDLFSHWLQERIN